MTKLVGYKKIIITYQVITGNYSREQVSVHLSGIITYQVITGNYSSKQSFNLV